MGEMAELYDHDLDPDDDYYDAMQHPKKERQMPRKKGIVSYVGYKKLKRATVWSFALDGDDNYYRTGFDRPERDDGEKIEEGDMVRFEYEKTKYGLEVDMDTLEVKEGDGPPPKKKAPARKSGGGGKSTENWDARAKYWEDKEKYDKEVTARMYNFRSAAQMAKDIVLKAQELDLLPKAKTKAAALDDLIEKVQVVRDQLFEELEEKVHLFETGEVQKEESPVAGLDEEDFDKDEPDSSDWDDDDDDWDD